MAFPDFSAQLKFTRQAFVNDRLKYQHIIALVYDFQERHGLTFDGKAGPETLKAIEGCYPGLFPPKDPAPFLYHPLPQLADGRLPEITSQFRKPDRPDHDGVDLFYRWKSGDQPAFVGDGGCEGRAGDGAPKWVVPYKTEVLAAADGVVQMAGPSPTGYRIWIDHGNGLRSGYFHLEQLYHLAGTKVRKWQPIGLVGHNPEDEDGRHLHFEVSPVEKYAPVDPEKYLVKW